MSHLTGTVKKNEEVIFSEVPVSLVVVDSKGPEQSSWYGSFILNLTTDFMKDYLKLLFDILILSLEDGRSGKIFIMESTNDSTGLAIVKFIGIGPLK